MDNLDKELSDTEKFVDHFSELIRETCKIIGIDCVHFITWFRENLSREDFWEQHGSLVISQAREMRKVLAQRS